MIPGICQICGAATMVEELTIICRECDAEDDERANTQSL